MAAKAKGKQGAAIARILLRPGVQAATTIREYAKGLNGAELMGLVEELADQAKAVTGGDLTRAEAMLAVQAHSLDAIFNSLARRAVKAEHMDNLDRYLRLALKAQSQCRATLETLAVIKNPPNVAFVKQANIAHGPQQVNNQTAHSSPRAPAGNQETEQTKLLEEKPYERLDTGTQSATVGADPPMETVGEIDRAENGGR
ncbi:MAG: hypothetical protein ACREYF_11545 [Gammaproteobacteria bacterium]